MYNELDVLTMLSIIAYLHPHPNKRLWKFARRIRPQCDDNAFVLCSLIEQSTNPFAVVHQTNLLENKNDRQI